MTTRAAVEGAVWECDSCHVQTLPFAGMTQRPAWWVRRDVFPGGPFHYCPACAVRDGIEEEELA